MVYGLFCVNGFNPIERSIILELCVCNRPDGLGWGKRLCSCFLGSQALSHPFRMDPEEAAHWQRELGWMVQWVGSLSILTRLLSLTGDLLNSYPHCSISFSYHEIMSLSEFKPYLTQFIIFQNSCLEVFKFPIHALGCHCNCSQWDLNWPVQIAHLKEACPASDAKRSMGSTASLKNLHKTVQLGIIIKEIQEHRFPLLSFY